MAAGVIIMRLAGTHCVGPDDLGQKTSVYEIGTHRKDIRRVADGSLHKPDVLSSVHMCD